MQKKKLAQLSRLRQQVDELLRLIDGWVDSALSVRERMAKGTVYDLRRKCGKAGCVCTKGNLHVTKTLSLSQGGKTRLVRLEPDRIGEAEVLTARYREFRANRARLAK